MPTLIATRFSKARRVLPFLLLSAACDLLSPAGPDGVRGSSLPASIEVRPSAIKMTVGGYAPLTGLVLAADGGVLNGWRVSYRSSDVGIASVDERSGGVTARAIGATTIVADAAGLIDTTMIVVSENQPLDIAFTSLSTIGNYACGLEAVTSLAYCWGDNHSGALGIGDAELGDWLLPVGGGVRRFRSLSVSAYYNCAIEMGTDRPFCWGGARIMLPYGASTPTLAGDGSLRLSAISAGTYVVCGIEAQSGRGYCWGQAELLGDGIGRSRATPGRIGGPTSDLRFASISASPGVVCGIERTSGLAYCWGRNDGGQLGDGTTTDRLLPTLVAGGAIRFEAISAGETVVCGLEEETGRAFCWGANSLGQLGDGTNSLRSVPTAVARSDLRFSSIDAGPNMTCAVEAVSGTVYCWGKNTAGSLGDGTLMNRSVPTRVAGDVRFASVSTGGGGGGYGGFETCGVEAGTGRAFCWGFSRLSPEPLFPPPGTASSGQAIGAQTRTTQSR